MNNFTNDLTFFLAVVDNEYKKNSTKYHIISKADIDSFKDHLSSSSNYDIESGSEEIRLDGLFDPLMEPLIQSSLAHFLFIKKNDIPCKKGENGEDIPDLTAFHPNYIRFRFMDQLVTNKASIRLTSFKLLDFSPSTVLIDRKILMQKVRELIHNPKLEALVLFFIQKLQADGDKSERILGFGQTKPAKRIGLLYFLFMELYLVVIDDYIHERIHLLNCFWVRCLTTGLICFSDQKTIPKVVNILKLDGALPAWGLTAKVSTGTRGGRVLRPWRGKLYINIDGHLQWERPESIIDM